MPIDPSTAFVSYSREDLELVLRLTKDLKAKGAKVWMDRLDIRLGQRWELEVESALNGCSRMLVIVSPASVASKNVLAEAAYAIDEGKEVIPVLIQECKIPFRLRPFQYADLSTDYAGGLDELLANLMGGPESTLSALTEQARLEEERNQAAEQVRLEKNGKRQEELERQRIAAEQARLEQEKRDRRAAEEKARQDELERQRIAAEQARLEQEQLERRANEEETRQEQLERQRIAAEQPGLERVEREREAAEQSRLEQENKQVVSQESRVPRPQLIRDWRTEIVVYSVLIGFICSLPEVISWHFYGEFIRRGFHDWVLDVISGVASGVSALVFVTGLRRYEEEIPKKLALLAAVAIPPLVLIGAVTADLLDRAMDAYPASVFGEVMLLHSVLFAFVQGSAIGFLLAWHFGKQRWTGVLISGVSFGTAELVSVWTVDVLVQFWLKTALRPFVFWSLATGATLWLIRKWDKQ